MNDLLRGGPGHDARVLNRADHLNLCCSCLVGAAAAPDGDRQTVPEKAHRDPGARAAGFEPGHAGEKEHFCFAAAVHSSRSFEARSIILLPNDLVPSSGL